MQTLARMRTRRALVPPFSRRNDVTAATRTLVFGVGWVWRQSGLRIDARNDGMIVYMIP